MSNGQWLALEWMGQLPALSSRRSVFLSSSEKSLCFYHEAEMRAEEEGGREGGKEQWRSKPVMAAGGWFPHSPPFSNPFSTHSFLTLYTHALCFTHISNHCILFHSCHAHTRVRTHIPRLHSFRFLHTCAHAPVVLILPSAHPQEVQTGTLMHKWEPKRWGFVNIPSPGTEND